MPLPLLLRAIEGCPADLIDLADRLEWVSLKVLMMLMAGPVGDAPDRVYIAGPEIPIHKLAFNHTSSPSLRARPVHAIMGEIAYSPDKAVADDADLTRRSLEGLVEAGLIASRAEVIETRMVDIPHGYPVYTPERPEILAWIRGWLTPRGVHTIGRFGGWDYVNSDACIRQGLLTARALRSDPT
jgi:protoporphyrinogen oxidase